jgi:hypothetical protein
MNECEKEFEYYFRRLETPAKSESTAIADGAIQA